MSILRWRTAAVPRFFRFACATALCRFACGATSQIMTYSLLEFKLRLPRERRARYRDQGNELAHPFDFRFGNLPAVADVKLGGRAALNFCACPSKSSAENQSRSRHSLFYVLEHLDRGSGNAVSALVRYDQERNFAPLLVRCKRRGRANSRNV